MYPPPTAHALISTPPTGARRLSRSYTSNGTADESGVGLRAGDTFLGFELIEELGQGAFARVFLARQQSLAGRPVALKVTLRPTREAERLARLQHTNVVPVYSVHNAPPVQVICMPFLGRRTIADVIRAYRADHSSREHVGRKTSGTRAVRTTDLVESGSAPKSRTKPAAAPKPVAVAPGDGPTLIGDPVAVLRVLGQLAAGLAHAHQRGILHLDLKPANVLLPDTGEPMLLDFNLSFDTNSADRELVGGTVPYMATEQLLDLRSRGRGAVDARTDLYSLGVMAYEMLTGVVPFPAASKDLIDMDGLIAARREGPPSVRKLNPAVTPAAEAIVHKLLAPEPKDRYQSAEELRADVERHLNDLPLRVAREPSLRERFGKWRRRNPGVPARLLAACVFGLALGLGAVAHERAEATAKFEAVARVRSTHAALDTTRLDLILPGDPAARARGIAKAEELLKAYGLPDDLNWTKRPDVRRLSDQDRAALAGNLGELLLLLARAKWQEAESRPESAQAAREILKLNRAAESCFPDGAPPLLDRQRAELAFAAGEPRAEPAAPDADRKLTAREQFLEATSDLLAGRYAAAVARLERVIGEQPNHAAAHFCLAYGRQQLGQSDRALERYDAAESLMPRDPRPAYQRGLIHALRPNHEEAEKEYTKAIGIDPNHTYAHRNRAFARLWQKKFREAEADLTKALALGAPALQIHLYRARARQGQGDAAGALADQHAAAGMTPKEESDYIARGRMRLDNEDHEGALDDFKAAGELNRQSLVAMQNQIHALADKLHRPKAALAVADRLAEAYPDYAMGRVARAMLLARLDRRADAHAEADRAMRLSKDPAVTYRAACVYALTSVTDKADEDKALALLSRALKDGFRDVALIKSDPYLKPLHDNPKFAKIVDAAASLFQ